jgi:hypothetical protein
MEERDMIFQNGPYFTGTQGMYLNKWSLKFNLENNIPFVVLVWMRLPHLPLHYWNDETLKCIGNILGRYIDKAYPKEGMFTCARICIEVDLEKGLP